MSKIIRDEENPENNILTIYHIALNLVGYISFYNALTELNKISKSSNNRKNRNLQSFMVAANSAVLKDFSIVLNELYAYLESLKPGDLVNHNIVEPRFDEFLKFVKKTKNNMKFKPSEKKMNKILEIQKNKYPNIWGVKNKDMLYYCGYYKGENVVFGSSLYLEYMFFEPKKICKNDGDMYLFTNSIMTHLETFFRTFEETIFKGIIDIPKIKFREQKRFFQIYPENISSDKVFKKATYDKISTFMLLLMLEEIASVQVYYDYFMDIDESIKDGLLLYFFTYMLAIKYDEIRDCLENLCERDEKFEKDFLKLNVLKKETTDFAYKLRNSYHYTEIEKYKIISDDDEAININMEELYLSLTQMENWPDDYINMLNIMRNDLNTILKFCRNNIGIKYG